jgi:beta-galactosidase
LYAGPAEEDETVYIDLKAKANHKLKDPFHDAGNFKENNLAALKIGVQKLGGVKFKIGESFLQLGSTMLPNLPEKFEGIPVNRKLAKLHFLHATGWGSAAEGDRTHVPDDTVTAKYIINYEDKTNAEIEVVHGRDVRDWWYGEGDKTADRSKVAWTGENPDSKRSNKKLRLFLTTWENPNPNKKIVSIDYVATKKAETPAAPFCVAMTGEAAR